MVRLSETCVTSEIHQSELDIKSYNIVGCESHRRPMEGTVIYIKRVIKYIERVNQVYSFYEFH